MEEYFFRGGRWILDLLNERDVKGHLSTIKLSIDVQLIMNYFLYFLFVDTDALGNNELSERHQDIKEGIIAIMSKRYDTGVRQLSPIIEGIVRKSLFNGGCTDNSSPYPKWIGNFHKYPQPRNFYQLLEGAIRDPRSRIGRTITYPPDQEIYHVSEMIRNPLAHGTQTQATLEDYRILFFILILLFHDIVNPHNDQWDEKYYKWVYNTSRNMRLEGKDPTLEKLIEIAEAQNLNVDKVKASYTQIQVNHNL